MSSVKSSVHSDDLNPVSKKQKVDEIDTELKSSNAVKYGIIEHANKDFKKFNGIVKKRLDQNKFT